MAVPAFEKWRQTFWDNLGASVQLHGIRVLLVFINARVFSQSTDPSGPPLVRVTPRPCMRLNLATAGNAIWREEFYSHNGKIGCLVTVFDS